MELSSRLAFRPWTALMTAGSRSRERGPALSAATAIAPVFVPMFPMSRVIEGLSRRTKECHRSASARRRRESPLQIESLARWCCPIQFCGSWCRPTSSRILALRAHWSLPRAASMRCSSLAFQMPRLAAARRRFHFNGPVLSIGRRLGVARSPRRLQREWRERGYIGQLWPSRSDHIIPTSHRRPISRT